MICLLLLLLLAAGDHSLSLSIFCSLRSRNYLLDFCECSIAWLWDWLTHSQPARSTTTKHTCCNSYSMSTLLKRQPAAGVSIEHKHQGTWKAWFAASHIHRATVDQSVCRTQSRNIQSGCNTKAAVASVVDIRLISIRQTTTKPTNL